MIGAEILLGRDPRGMVDISVLGMPRLQRKLHTLERKMQKKLVMQALRPGGKIILAQAKANCPVRTGAMKRSMKLRVAKLSRKRKRAGLFGLNVITGTRKDLGIPDNAKYFYPAGVEWGTDKLPANAPMRRATDTKRTEAIAAIATKLHQLVLEAVTHGH